MKSRLTMVVVLAAVAIGVALTVALWPEPEPEPIVTAPEDTGMTVEQREAFMRTIGYVQ